MSMGLWLTAGASIAAGALGGLAAWNVWRRPYSGHLRAAGRAHAVWWIAFALILLDDGARVLLGLAAESPVPLYVALVRLKIVLTGLGLAALATYVAFLWRGDHRAAPWILSLGLLHAVYFLARLGMRLPAEVHTTPWTTRLVLHGTGGTGIPVPPALGALLFFLPGIVIAACYGALWPRLAQPGSRARLLAVMAALALIFLVGSIQYSPFTPGDSRLFPVFAALTLAAGVLALVGTRAPPRGTLADGSTPASLGS